MLIASILLGTMGGALNSYVVRAQDEGFELEGGVCKDKVVSGGTCYTFGCFCAYGSCKCEYYGPSCGHGPSCSQNPN